MKIFSLDLVMGEYRTTLARLRPELVARHPSIPSGTWHVVLPHNPAALHSEAEPGFVWLEIEGRPRKLPVEYFEFIEAS